MRGKRDSPIRADMKNTPRKLQSRPLASENRGTAFERGMGGGQKRDKCRLWVASTKSEGTHPCLLPSISRGETARMYVQVQTSRSMTRRSDWKLKSADCG